MRELLREIFLVRRVVEEDVEPVGEGEFQIPHAVVVARLLADAGLHLARQQRPSSRPGSLGRTSDTGGPVLHHLIAAALQIAIAHREIILRDLAGQMVGRVPIGIVDDVIHDAGDHRRRIFGLAGDDLHRIIGLAVFEQGQHLIARIDDHEAAVRGDRAKPVEIGEQPRVGRRDAVCLRFGISGVAQLGVEEVGTANWLSDRPRARAPRRRSAGSGRRGCACGARIGKT